MGTKRKADSQPNGSPDPKQTRLSTPTPSPKLKLIPPVCDTAYRWICGHKFMDECPCAPYVTPNRQWWFEILDWHCWRNDVVQMGVVASVPSSTEDDPHYTRNNQIKEPLVLAERRRLFLIPIDRPIDRSIDFPGEWHDCSSIRLLMGKETNLIELLSWKKGESEGKTEFEFDRAAMDQARSEGIAEFRRSIVFATNLYPDLAKLIADYCYE